MEAVVDTVGGCDGETVAVNTGVVMESGIVAGTRAKVVGVPERVAGVKKTVWTTATGFVGAIGETTTARTGER